VVRPRGTPPSEMESKPGMPVPSFSISE
jgi:hypothetical protein